ncbi:hypothetical protein LR003_00840 [candidate division NPL-UPA2 bacterium]|nr:hypothetical protein [candidate division NPL-UPA2 bacterium]
MTQIISEIRKVEEGSEQLIQEAREKAKQTIGEAKVKSKELLAKAKKEAGKEAASLREKALEEAREEARLIDKNTVKKRENLKEAAGKNFPEAVSFIVGKIIPQDI